MKISVNWLKNYVDIPSNTDFNQLGELFTTRTAEIEEIIDLGKSFDNMVIGKIIDIKPHPQADKLQITTTDVGTNTLQIICGANNIFVGQTVAVALENAVVRWHGEGEPVVLKPTKIRGEESFGMICAASEIGLKDEVDGIIDLCYIKAAPGTPLAEALQKNDIIIDIDNKSLTHRPDLWGHYGIAREMAAITDKTLKKLDLHSQYDQKLKVKIPVEVEAKDLCRRYLSTTIENIKVEASPLWLKNALENTGNRSINNIVDATNFVMLELGNPLHAFDTKKINDKIIVRRAKDGEEIETLNEGSRKLTNDNLVIADSKKAIALAGVMGGINSGIENDTTSITLEAANFDPVSTRKTSVAVGIRTESVMRYEKDIDAVTTEMAFDRLVHLILTLCPTAKIVAPKIDIDNSGYKTKIVDLNTARAVSKIGVEIDTQNIKEILEKLEFKVIENGKNKLQVEVPHFRATKDVNHQDDLTEEIARMYGYEKIPSHLPELALRLPLKNTEREEKHEIRNLLSLACGYHEALNYSFYSEKTFKACGLDEAKHLKLKNYLSEEQTHLRTSLIPNLLMSAANNLKNQDTFKLFEIGRTYVNEKQFFPLEEKHIAGVMILPAKTTFETFHEVRDDIGKLLQKLRINCLGYKKSEMELPYAHPNKTATFMDYRSHQEIIHIFELHPLIAKRFGLEKCRTACFEINYTKLHALPRADKKIKNISKFPAIEFDVSVQMDRNLEIASIEKQIAKADSGLIRDIKLFDYYQGENIPADKKSLAFRITMQSDERTLTDAEMKSTQKAVFENLQKIGGNVRGL